MLRFLKDFPLAQGLVLAMLVLIGSLIFSGHVLNAADVPHLDTSNPLLVSNRQSLSICVNVGEGVGVPPGVAVTKVRTALTELETHPLWRYYEKYPVTINAGCPRRSFLLEGGVVEALGVLRTTPPSQHRVYVFVLSNSELSRALSGHSRRSWPQEVLCVEDDCSEVSTGLYLSDAELPNAAFLAKELAKSLGLEPWLTDEETNGLPNSGE